MSKSFSIGSRKRQTGIRFEWILEKDTLQKIMETPPLWAAGLPLKAEPETKARYSK